MSLLATHSNYDSHLPKINLANIVFLVKKCDIGKLSPNNNITI